MERMKHVEGCCYIEEILDRLRTSIKKDDHLSRSIKHPKALYYYLNELNQMVGLAKIKRFVSKLVFRHTVEVYDNIRPHDKNDNMSHILILGPPGSGKSTISEVVSNIICAIGFLKAPGPEVFKELEEDALKETNGGEPSQLIPGVSGFPLTNTNSARIGKISNNDLKKKNVSLSGKLVKAEQLSRNVHEKTSEITGAIDLIQSLLIQEKVGEVTIPDCDPLVNGTHLYLRSIVHSLNEIRSCVDQLVAVTHVTEHPQLIIDAQSETPNSGDSETETIAPEPDFKPRYVAASRSDLIGRFVGQTAPKVRHYVAKALGGVLFIDEAYSLVNKTGDGVESFSNECVNTLCGYMSKYSQYFVVFMAGYASETIDAVNINRGMKRRFPNILTIDDYNPEQVGKIFVRQLSLKGFSLDKSINVTEFVSRHRSFFGTTGSVTSNMTTFCGMLYSVKRFREICNDDVDRSTAGIITLDILNESMKDISENDKVIKENVGSPPEMLYS